MGLPVWSWKGLRVLGDQPGKKRVSRFTFCSVEPGHVNGGEMEEKDWFAPVLAALPLRPGKDYDTFGLPVTPERRGSGSTRPCFTAYL